MSRTFILSAFFLCSVANASYGQSADNRPGAYIVAPKEGAQVERTSEFTGKTFLRGQPLALVRPLEGDGLWWVQRGIKRNARGQLLGTLQFGNAMAESGSRFAVVVIVAQTPFEREFFAKHDSLDELPQNVPRSEIRNVVLGLPIDESVDETTDAEDETKASTDANPPTDATGHSSDKDAGAGKDAEAKPAAKADASTPGPPPKFGLTILKPLNKANVPRFDELVGRAESDDDSPVVLVRPEGLGEQWWVQDKVVFGEGRYFKTRLRFGNERTTVGTRFMVLVVSPRPGPEAAAMKAGAAFAKLPPGIRRSAPVIVQLGPTTKAAKTSAAKTSAAETSATQSSAKSLKPTPMPTPTPMPSIAPVATPTPTAAGAE